MFDLRLVQASAAAHYGGEKDGDGGFGALTHFGTRNSIYYLLNGTGLGLRYALSDQFEISAGYLANDAANPNAGSGLFNGPYGAMAQLTFKPSEAFAVGLTYIHAIGLVE